MLGLPFIFNNILSALTKNALYVKCKVVIDALFTLATVTLVPTLAISTIYWAIEDPASMKVSSVVSEKVSAIQGQVTRVRSEIKVETGGPEMVYHLQLVDKEGVVKYTYPEYKTQEDRLKIQDINIKLPDNIKPGEYSLIAEVKYLANPLKLTTTQVELAHIDIAQNSK